MPREPANPSIRAPAENPPDPRRRTTSRVLPDFALMRSHWFLGAVAPILIHLALASPAASQADDRPPVTVQPGAPGEPGRVLDSSDVAALDRPTHTEADVRFIQGMIRHHDQALEMVDLLRTRSESADLHRLALRIEISQEDEIDLMEGWLEERNERVPEARMPDERSRDDGVADGGSAAEDGASSSGTPPGMLAPNQMSALAGTRGERFDRLFLELMIEHHEGALRMVEELFRSPGGGQVSSVYHIAAEVQADQAMEIQRMRRMLEELSDE